MSEVFQEAKEVARVVDSVLSSLSPILYYYFEKYKVNSAKNFTVTPEDGLIISNILKSRIHYLYEMKGVLEFMDKPVSWIYTPNYNLGFNMKFFWESFNKYNKGADILRWLLEDAREFVKPNDTELFM